MRRSLFLVVMLAATAAQAQTGAYMRPSKLKLPASNDLPATCVVGDVYMDTNATTGQRLYLCESTNSWVVVADGTGSGLAGDPAACSANQFANDIAQDGTLGCAAVSDITCTDCLNATEIEDIYLLDDGDVGTGAYDFGGASDFEIPNGTAPTVNAAGEVGVDTTDDQFVYYGGAARVLPYEFEKCVALEDPVDADDNIPFFFPRNAITITDVYCEVDGGTSIALTISDGTNALEAITCDGDGAEDDGSIANGTFTALERMEFDLGAPSGSVTWLAFCVTYTVDRQ